MSTVHSVAGVQFRGHVTSHGDILTFQGSLAAEAEDRGAVSASPQLIVSWQLGTEPGRGRVVQTSTVMWTTGLTGHYKPAFPFKTNSKSLRLRKLLD